jgi:hypothetical protein
LVSVKKIPSKLCKFLRLFKKAFIGKGLLKTKKRFIE